MKTTYLTCSNALATIPNASFKSFVRTERQKWELGGNKTAREIISESLTIYNDAVSAHTWTTTDPKDAKIIALTTKVDKLLKLQAFVTSTMPNGSSDGHRDKRDKSKLNHVIHDWRMVKMEPMTKRDGKT